MLRDLITTYILGGGDSWGKENTLVTDCRAKIKKPFIYKDRSGNALLYSYDVVSYSFWFEKLNIIKYRFSFSKVRVSESWLYLHASLL